MVYCTGLENRRPERVRGFESHSLRQTGINHRDTENTEKICEGIVPKVFPL